ncbi:hypothetical protein [Actinoplanes sp. NPDC089786]|uniref:hypothetical protein n=1 Tax=Actinoplanes sp. NPDC089786 TaxID=3155185 RepID=UPI003428F378
MDLTRLLVALHPPAWRRRYGDEFAALLDDTRLTPRAMADVVANAARLRCDAHTEGLLIVAALAVATVSRVIAHREGFAVNVLWVPATVLGALTLAGAVGPWVALIVRRWRRSLPRAGTYGVFGLMVVHPLAVQGDPGPEARTGLIVTLVGVAVLVALVVAIVSKRWRRPVLRFLGLTAGGLPALYLVVRGIAEFWVVDYDNPASYRDDWGGPSLLGVFAVHTGPAVLILAATTVWLVRRLRREPVARSE